MVELMVAAVLLIGAVFAASNYISKVMETRNQRLMQIMFKFMAIQTSQTLSIDPGFFPPVTSAGAPVHYIGCFGKTGGMVANKDQLSSFVYYKGALAVGSDAGICDSLAWYESRFSWVTPAAGAEYREVVIHIQNLKRTQVDNFKTKTFKIIAR